MCTEAANNITTLLNSYASLYSLRRVSFVVPHAVLASSAIHLANMSDIHVPKALQSGLDGLADMCLGDSFAASSLGLIKFIANKWGIPLIIVERSPLVRHAIRSQDPAAAGPSAPDAAESAPPSLAATLLWDWATTSSYLAYPSSSYSIIPPHPSSPTLLQSRILTTDKQAGQSEVMRLHHAGFEAADENVFLYSRARLPPIREMLGPGDVVGGPGVVPGGRGGGGILLRGVVSGPRLEEVNMEGICGEEGGI